jgi:hypothetical protein
MIQDHEVPQLLGQREAMQDGEVGDPLENERTEP